MASAEGDIQELWSEIRRIRDRLHDWAGHMTQVEHHEDRMNILEEWHRTVQPEIAVLRAELSSFMATQEREASRTRWIVGIAFAAISIGIQLLFKFV